MLITLVSVKVMLDWYGGIADAHEAHSDFCVDGDVFLQDDAGFRYTWCRFHMGSFM
jgi:hypothetical protein